MRAAHRLASADRHRVGASLCLPSGDSALSVVRGDLSAIPTLIMHWLGRSVLIGVGLAVSGLTGWQLIASALLGAAAIEVSVLAWAVAVDRGEK